MRKQLPSFLQKLVFAASLFTASLCSGIAHAQIPQFYTPAVSSYNNYPFNGTTSGGSMCQFMYMPSNFQSTPAAALITTIYFKAATTGSYSYTNMLIKMGNTTATGLVSGTWNGGLTTVYSQTSVTWSWTTGNWYSITLSTPFLYTGGNMIVEASQAGTPGSGGMGVWYFAGSATQRMYGITGSTGSTGADVNPLSFGFDGAPPNCSGTPLTPTITSAAFPAATPLCAGGATTITGADPNLPVNGMAYQWQSSASATGPWANVTNGSGATTLTYTTGPVSTNTYFRIGAICTNSSVTSYSTPFLVPVGTPQPGIITGSSTFCPGDTATYSVPFVAGSSYTWTLPSGWTGFSTTNSILVTPGPGASAATISVTAVSPCGPVSIARTRAIVPGSAPGSPGTISGNNFICGNTAQTYSIAPVGGATNYIWTLPNGWTGSSNTNSINVITNNASGTISVKALNGCGQSGTTPLAVTVFSALANPGTITGKDTVCSGTLQTYSIAAVPGATSYVWTLPSGWSGTTTGTSIQAFAGASTGTLSVTAYVSCSISPTSSKPINVVTTVNPAVTISAPPTVLCQGAPITITATPSFPGSAPNYQWKKNGLNVFAFGNSYTSNTLVTGDTIRVVMTSNAACAANATATSNALAPNITPSVIPGVSINTVPPIVLCKGTSVTFTSSSTGTGATPSYQWFKNGAPIVPAATGTTYTDAGLNNADTLTIRMTTSAVCATMPVATSNKVGVTVNDQVTPTVSIAVSPSNIVLPGMPLTFTATQSNGGATPDYQWQKNGVNIPFETGDTYTSSTLSPGDHISVKMLSYDPCATKGLVTSNEIVLKSALGVAGAGGWDGGVKLYPNPTNGHFNITASWDAVHSGRQVHVEVLSGVGQVVHRIELMPSGISWQTEVSLPAGIANGRYMLRISTDDGMKTTLPFVLNR